MYWEMSFFVYAVYKNINNELEAEKSIIVQIT